MRKQLLAGVALAGLIGVGPAMAGNVFLTGHDNDFHQSANAKTAMTGALSFVENGSSLPVLTFDAGSELTGLLTSMGVSFVNVNPSGPISDSVFDHTLYSAFVVASVTSCGGCDNTPDDIANIASHSAAIASFFNAGGGIIGLAGADDPNAYAYVPESATNAGGNPPRTGYVTTAQGVLLGIPAVNGDTTHNFFDEPGSGGLSPNYVVTERLGDPVTGTPESIALKGGHITCTGPTCHISTPEPMGLTLLGAGLIGLGAVRRRAKR